MKDDKNKVTFINEVIKEKPLSKKRIFLLIIVVAVLGAVFGTVMAICFVQLKNHLEEKSDTEAIVSNQTEDQNLSDEKPEEKPQVVVNDVVLDVEAYETMTSKLYDVGVKADGYVVTVTARSNDTDWFDSTDTNNYQGCGIVFKKARNSLFILTQYSVIKGADDIEVTLHNGFTVRAQMKGFDSLTGLAVVSVKKENIPSDILKHIKEANISGNNSMKRGMSVVAVGSPLGVNFSIVTGFVTSLGNEASIADRNYSMFMTDITSRADGLALILDSSGKVLGLVTDNVKLSQSPGTLTAIYADELVSIIDTIKQGKSVPYIGIEVATVTNAMAESYNLPHGVYAKGIDEDSPAFDAGLQVGDVINAINGDPVTNVSDYMARLNECEPKQTLDITVMRMGSDKEYSEIEISVMTDMKK